MAIKSIADLRKLKKAQNASVANEIDQKMQRKRASDPRFWTPTFGKDGKANAVIRFLPPHPDEEDTSVKVMQHFYKGPNGVYAETSRETIGETDPCQEFGWKVYNLGGKANQNKGRQFLATEKYVCNIYVKEDENAPENNGKVFLWAAPKTVMTMVKEAIEGNVKKGIEPKDVIGLVDCHDFIVDLYKVDKFPKYDKCAFSGKATDLFDDEDMAKYNKVMDSQFKLGEFVDPANIKPYSELKAKLKDVLGREYDAVMNAEPGDGDKDEDDRPTTRATSSRASSRTEEAEGEETKSSDDGDADDEDSYYQRLANRRNKK